MTGSDTTRRIYEFNENKKNNVYFIYKYLYDFWCVLKDSDYDLTVQWLSNDIIIHSLFR